MNPDRATRMGKGRFGRFFGFWLLAWLALAGAPAAWGATIYVKTGASGTGTSWANASGLQTALAAAAWGDEIWVAAGTYKPTTGTDRTISFVMPGGVGIYGGFAGTETARAQRDWSAHATILSGDIGTIGDASDNSYHVVAGGYLGVLDGFTITGGYANGSSSYYGGGMINDSVSPTIANCTFTNNTASHNPGGGAGSGAGGGMFNKNASPTVTNCTFTNNTASIGGNGGGMCNDDSSPTVTNCTFTNNTASTGCGGGMCNGDSSPTVTNCTFTNNTASNVGNIGGGGMCNITNSSPTSLTTVTNCTFTGNTATSYGGGICNDCGTLTVTNCTFTNNTANYGGGMDNMEASPTVTNCTFVNNTASDSGGGMYNYWDGPGTFPTVTNCIFWNDSALAGAQVYNDSGTPTFKYCDIEGSGASGSLWNTALGTDGGGNIMGDPLFANASSPAGPDGVWRTSDDGLRLLVSSPCIDAGTTDGAPTTDILGNARVGLPDIGAYEYQPPRAAAEQWTLYR